MVWTIIKKELIDHITSFRFSAIFTLALLLMVVSVLVFSTKYELAGREYPQRVEHLVNADGTVNLASVACEGGAAVRRLPSPLAFCSGAGEQELPNEAILAVHGLRSVQRSSEIGSIYGGSTRVDWAFVVATILSFGAGLLTYKTVSGELRDGTLTLMLSNPVSRASVLMGKYLAALIALEVAFSLAMLLSLFVLQRLDVVQLNAEDWLKIGLFWMVSTLYLSLFIVLGLLCSVVTRGPLLSAVVFLIAWVTLVFVIPNLAGILAIQFGKTETPLQVHQLANAIPDRFSLTPAMSAEEVASTKLQRELAGEDLLLGYVQSLIRQITFGRNLTRISPVIIYYDATEGITGGGTYRLQGFVKNVVHFREGFLRAILDADKLDPESEHRYVPWWCGSDSKHFSQRVVGIGPAAKFRDEFPRTGEGFVSAIWEMLLLAVLNIAVFAIAFWRFARQDVAPSPGVL